MTEDEARLLGQLAIGRLLRICSRPFQEGDHEEYDRVRDVLRDVAEAQGRSRPDNAPNLGRKT